MSTRTCRACSLPIANVHGTTRYHPECRSQRPPNHACAICGRAYWNSHRASMYCSKSCSNRSRLIPPEIRYWSLVQIGDPDECWPWLAACRDDGYGAFTIDAPYTNHPGKQMAAHRAGYQFVHGVSLMPHELVLHTCIGHRWCQNPMHLYVGSVQDNSDDMVEQERQVRGEIHYASIFKPEDVLAIRLRHGHGERVASIAAGYPFASQAAIYAIIRRQTWKHL
jgi:hypothetical protein